MTNSFDIGTRFTYEGQQRAVISLHDNDEIMIETIESGERVRVTQAALIKAYYRGDIVFEYEYEPTELPEQETLWGDIPDARRTVAEQRYKVIQSFLSLEGRERRQAIQAWCAESATQQDAVDGQAPLAMSKSTIYAWIRLYKEGGILALVPKKRSRQKVSRLGDEVEQIIEKSIKANTGFKAKPGIERVYLDTFHRLTRRNSMLPEDKRLPIPSRRTVARRVALHDPEGKVRHIRNRTPNRIQQASYTRELVPLEVVEIDHTTLDLIIIDEETNLVLGRPTFTLCIDAATRVPTGFYNGFQNQSYGAVFECMFHSILPKDDDCEKYQTSNHWPAHGVPSTLIVDNGREFIGKDLRNACQQLGIALEASPVATPQHKSHVERMYRTINDGLIHYLRGTTGSNPQHRGEYDSEGEAVYTLSGLNEAITIYLVDVYCQTVHRSLGMTPAERWESLGGSSLRRELSPRPDELAITLSRSETRVVQPYGIEWHSQQYWSSKLDVLRSFLLRTKGNAKVTVRMHEGNMGKVYVYDEEKQRYITALSKDPRLEGVSLSFYKRIREVQKELYGTQNDGQIAGAKARLARQDEKARRSKNMRDRSKVAREEEIKATNSLAALENSSQSDPTREKHPDKPNKPRESFIDSIDEDSARDRYVVKQSKLNLDRLNQQEKRKEDKSHNV